MAKRIVRNALVRYVEDGQRRFAFNGQEIDVDQSIIDELGDQLYPAGEGPDTASADAGGGSPAGVDLDGGSVEDAAAWLKGDADGKPKASEVVAAANGDVDRAQLLLEAEQSLSGDPRKSVVDGLRKIIDGDGGA